MGWIFGIVGLLLGWVLAAWLARRACEARIRAVEATWSAKLASGDQAFAARIRQQEAVLEAERQRIDEEWSAKLAAREAGWKNRLASQESDLKTQLEALDAKLADRRRAEIANARPKPADRFTDIDGIGRRTGEVLAAAGIMTFWRLANTPVDDLREVLEQAGGQFRTYDPSTWPSQARLAAEHRMSELAELQEWLRSR